MHQKVKFVIYACPVHFTPPAIFQYGRKTAVVPRRTAVSSGLRIRIELQFLVLKKLSKNCGCILEKNPVTEG